MCSKQPRKNWQQYFDIVPELSTGLPIPIFGVMLLIWQLRDKDLQISYPLETTESRIGFIVWCVLHGRHEYLALKETSQFWNALNQPAEFPNESLPKDDPAHAISWLMALIIPEIRPDLEFDLTTGKGRQKLVAWYLQHGREELQFQDIPCADWQITYFLSASARTGLNCLQALIYEARLDVQKAFPLPTETQNYLTWFEHFLTVETKLSHVLLPNLNRSLLQNAAVYDYKFPFGVNIIGYVFGQLGIGEDARMVAKSLLTTDVPMTLLDFPLGADIPQAEREMESYVSSEPKYAINLFCLAALEQGHYLAKKGKQLFEGRYNIGYWPWELSQWPNDWRHLLSLVDEVWVYNQYIYEALLPVSPVPVRSMPVAVEAVEISKLTRKDFGLPNDTKLFLFAFDFNSSATRKNPKACVSAFLKAFPVQDNQTSNTEQVGLVIKVHPPTRPNREWDELKDLQKNDARIYLIEQTLTKPDLLALYNVCDCFLSLHRAEGFGRCIAEAMLLGKPVITTGFSGNLAFTSQENTLLVNYQLLQLGNNDYPYGTGQSWAEPDVAHAAEQMRKLIATPNLAKMLAEAGQQTIQKFHNTKAIGMRYKEILHTINIK
jgi:glycosyltransferase involved in cell wall biosynthesis